MREREGERENESINPIHKDENYRIVANAN